MTAMKGKNRRRRRRLVVSMFLSAAAALLLTTTTTTVLAQEEEEEHAHMECVFSAPMQLTRGVQLEHFKNTNEETFTMRLTYTGGEGVGVGGLAWVSIGVNSDGGTKMIPGTAIIGRMLYDEDEITPLGSSVLKYDLVTDDEDGSGVMPMMDELQTLMDATFEQDEETETSVLTFTQKLDDSGMQGGPITDESSWIYAIGLPDNQWQGKHEVHGSFLLPLEDHCVKMNINTPHVQDEDEEDAHEDGPGETSVGIPEPEEPTEPEEPPTDAGGDNEDDTNADNGGDEAEEIEDVQEDVDPSEPEQQQPTADDNTTDTGADAGNGDPVVVVEEEPEQPTADDNTTDVGADAGNGGDPVVGEEEPPAVSTTPKYDCSFGEVREVFANKFTLEHYKNTAAGTYTMRLTYLVGSAWVSIGVNHEGTFKMAPSTCIIGRIEYAEDSITPIGSSVLKYDVTNHKEDASGVITMADELQTLMDATFEQNGETSVLTFTQKLVDSGMNDQPITDESSWIYAVGLPDNQWEGTHKVHGSFFLPLEENCVAGGAVADDGEPAEPEPADDEPVVDYVCSFVEPRELWVDKVNLEHYKNTEAGTYTMRLTYLKGDAWVSIGVNHEGSFLMAPSSCIVGRIEYDEDGITPIGSSVLKYDVTNHKEDGSGVVPMADEFQTLMNATFEQDGETSVLTFTQKLDDSGMNGPITDESSWIYAIGLPDNQWEGTHKIHGSFFLPLEDNCVGFSVDSATGPKEASGIVMRQDVTEKTFPLWVAHGWTMAVAWGLVGPVAIGSAILRRLVGSNWYKIHFYLNMLCVVLTIVGFGLAVAAINMEEKPHFTPKTSQGDLDQIHHNAGLAIFIIVILQSVAGYFRPPVAPAPAPAPEAAPATVENEAKLLDDDDVDKQKPSLRREDTRKTDTEGDTSHGKVRATKHSYGKISSFDNEVVLESTPEYFESPHRTPSNETSADDGLEGSQVTKSTSDDTAQQKPKSPWVRKMWEIQHRLTGAVVVGLAWYNCHTGYLLMEDNYDERQDYTVVFWSVTGAIVGTIFILGYAAKM